MPRVSIALPVYNGERYVGIAIEALLAQTYQDFEFIITDNASTDHTEQICREYAARDTRIRYHRNAENIGAPRNFNLSFELSHGEYLKWATSDDYVAPDMIEKCVDVLDRNPDVVLCFPNATLIDADGNFLSNYDDVLDLRYPLARDRFTQLLTRIKLAHQHLGLIRTSALKKTALHGSFFSADIIFLAELSLYGKFYNLREYLLFRRFHPGSSSWDRGTPTHQTSQLAWCDPGRGKRIRLDRWEATWTLFDAVRRSPAPLRDKILMDLYLLRRMRWQFDVLGRELIDSCREIGRRWFSRSTATADG